LNIKLSQELTRTWRVFRDQNIKLSQELNVNSAHWEQATQTRYGCSAKYAN